MTKYISKRVLLAGIFIVLSTSFTNANQQQTTTGNPGITTHGLPAQLDIRKAGDHSVRITLKPISYGRELPFTPVLADQGYPEAAISLREIEKPVRRQIDNLRVEIRPDPLTVVVTNAKGELVQEVSFRENGTMWFRLDDRPVLGMGEGGPRTDSDVDWRTLPIEFDRRGRYHNMHPRWQSGAYGSRNPVAMLVGTRGWGLFVATPWGEIDLSEKDHGIFIPRARTSVANRPQSRESQHANRGQGVPPLESIIPGLYDLFVFDAHDPPRFMEEVSQITGQAVMPPKWSMGYMQSHRTLEDDAQLVNIVDTFREKEIPVDALIYLGTGFTPRGWNTEQPSFDFNPEVFSRNPEQVLADLHDRNVKIVVHMVPWDRDKLPTLHGSIPPEPGEAINGSHIKSYWQQHVDLVNSGVDAFWPDEGDWFNLFERMKRHQLYYEGPLSTKPDTRPWSLHRNGHLGIARWGGWMWSGDTHSTWKTLEGQIAVGINHSLSLSPYWGSDIGGFYPTEELTGELYARWFQFGAFCPSFRSHGRTWWTRLPWGWGLSELGPLESGTPPDESALNNPAIEPVTKKYAELRYRLLPYNYSLAWEARNTGMPFMRAMWLHYPDDEYVAGIGDQYLWGRDLLIAPVYEQGASFRSVYLPEGEWYDWWDDTLHEGGKPIAREVDLSTMPIYVRAGAIIPVDPVRQYVDEPVDEPTTLRIYPGANGEFMLYHDDGESLDYLEGEFSLTRLSWNDEEQVLTVEPGKGNSIEKQFRVRVIGKSEVKTFDYRGKRVRVGFD